MIIILQYNASDKDHLDKDISDLSTKEGTLRDECSIENPLILIHAEPGDLVGCNYFSIPSFGRKYYLTGQRVIRTGLIEISGHVDVLSSFADSIRAQTAIVMRSESSTAYNLYLNDGSLRAYQNPYVLTEVFPNGFTGNSFILSVAGNSNTPTALHIVTEPSDATVQVGEDAVFRVTIAGGSGVIYYQWQYKTSTSSWASSTLPGATTNAITVGGTAARNGYQYRCKVARGGEQVTTRAATLTVV